MTLKEYERAQDKALMRLNAAQKAYDAAWDAWMDAINRERRHHDHRRKAARL